MRASFLVLVLISIQSAGAVTVQYMNASGCNGGQKLQMHYGYSGGSGFAPNSTHTIAVKYRPYVDFSGAQQGGGTVWSATVTANASGAIVASTPTNETPFGGDYGNYSQQFYGTVDGVDTGNVVSVTHQSLTVYDCSQITAINNQIVSASAIANVIAPVSGTATAQICAVVQPGNRAHTLQLKKNGVVIQTTGIPSNLTKAQTFCINVTDTTARAGDVFTYTLDNVDLGSHTVALTNIGTSDVPNWQDMSPLSDSIQVAGNDYATPTPYPSATPFASATPYATPTPAPNGTPPPSISQTGSGIYAQHTVVDNPDKIYGPIIDKLNATNTLLGKELAAVQALSASASSSPGSTPEVVVAPSESGLGGANDAMSTDNGHVNDLQGLADRDSAAKENLKGLGSKVETFAGQLTDPHIGTEYVVESGEIVVAGHSFGTVRFDFSVYAESVSIIRQVLLFMVTLYFFFAVLELVKDMLFA